MVIKSIGHLSVPQQPPLVQAARPERPADALQKAMIALANCEALFIGIRLMLDSGQGEPISLAIMGQSLACAAHTAADEASIAAGCSDE
jgi:hypothetical protein